MKFFELVLGEKGSPERLAADIRLAIRLIDKEGLLLSLDTERRLAIRQMAQALEDYDAEFFRRLATGLEKLQANLPPRPLKLPLRRTRRPAAGRPKRHLRLSPQTQTFSNKPKQK